MIYKVWVRSKGAVSDGVILVKATSLEEAEAKALKQKGVLSIIGVKGGTIA